MAIQQIKYYDITIVMDKPQYRYGLWYDTKYYNILDA